MDKEMGLGELLAWLLYLVAFILPLNTLTVGSAVLVLSQVYFVVAAARSGKKVTRPEIPGGFLILNVGFILIEVSWEIVQVLSMVTALILILWGIKLTFEVEE
jgi:hypothetical protein